MSACNNSFPEYLASRCSFFTQVPAVDSKALRVRVRQIPRRLFRASVGPSLRPAGMRSDLKFWAGHPLAQVATLPERGTLARKERLATQAFL